MYRQALFQKHGIRDCVVKIDRMSENDILNVLPKKSFRLTPTTGTPRKNVSWIPASSSTQGNSTDALYALDIHRNRNDVVPRVVVKNVKRQRAKSMFAERANKFTIDDLHVEFTEKYSSPNRGLKPGNGRQLLEPRPKPLSECQRIHGELQAKLAAKRATAAAPPPPPAPLLLQAKLSWDQLKALEPKKYPVVQCNVERRPRCAPMMTDVTEGSSSAYEQMNQSIQRFFEYV